MHRSTDIIVYNKKCRLAASVYGHTGAPNVLCLHGISGSRDTWEETVHRLEDRYRVWTLDFRGHGHSDRADRYLLDDYVSDAAAMLDAIGQATTLIGHSLGGITAAALAQVPHPFVTAVFLEDPPMYLGEQSEWDKGIYASVFPILRDKAIELQSKRAGLGAYLEFAANTPAIQGGVAADHVSPRHLDSIASALQRHDPATWAPVLDLTAFQSLDSSLPLRVPARVVQADPTLGPALMAGHDQRFMATNPTAEVILYEGATHRIHATRAASPRFLDDVDAFVTHYARGGEG